MTAEKSEGVDSLSDDAELKTAQNTWAATCTDCVHDDCTVQFHTQRLVQSGSDAYTRVMTSKSTSDESKDCPPWQPEIAALRQEKIKTEGINDDETQALANDEHPFCFESDHLALRNNADYHQLLQALVALERQRSQAIQDLEKLHTMQDRALKDPTSFIQRLRNETCGLEDELPTAQAITQVPRICWDVYGAAAQEAVALAAGDRFVGARRPANHAAVNSAENGRSQKQSKHPSEGDIVRGRVYSQNKPSSFNRLWTAEEQAKLEELLVKYPSEQTEAKRWEKIAGEMGNRTPKQIASRVQKYFIKLAKAGLPIPGRIPSSTMCKKGRVSPYSVLSKPSTFFSTHRPHVLMDNNDGDDESHTTIPSHVVHVHQATIANSQPNRLLPLEDEQGDDLLSDPLLKDTSEYRELVRLQQMRQSRLQSGKIEAADQHLNQRTSVPNSAPWLDQTIPQKNYIDRDYVPSGVYSYLDPNYRPTES